MPDLYAYVSHKISDDDVPGAIKEARAIAVKKLGGEDVALVEKSWSSKEVCTRWMRTVPDTPSGS